LILYSTHCPKCNVLKAKLDMLKIEYQECNDEEIIISKGFTSVPILEVNGIFMNFIEAIRWASEV